MALRDQPYIPLYIQDFLTDEKLIECSAQATGVYVRLMCIMHKSEEYGKVLLKQKDKQSEEQVRNFALKLAKQMPYTETVIFDSITELLAEKVIFIQDDFICQKRMIKDNSISLVRSTAGQTGGKIAQAKVKASKQANSEIENEVENAIENGIIIVGAKKDFWIGLKAKYLNEKPTRIYDLRLYFKQTHQLEQFESSKWANKIDEFMKDHPGKVFEDDGHLYNSFKIFCTTPKIVNGKPEKVKSFEL